MMCLTRAVKVMSAESLRLDTSSGTGATVGLQ